MIIFEDTKAILENVINERFTSNSVLSIVYDMLDYLQFEDIQELINDMSESDKKIIKRYYKAATTEEALERFIEDLEDLY